MTKKMIKPITIEMMLYSIMCHSERINKLLGDDITLDKEDEDKLRDAYRIILRLHYKVDKERRDIEKSIAKMK